MLDRWIWLVMLLLVALGGLPDAWAQSAIVTEAPNWCELAKEFLRKRDGSAFNCNAAGRCIKLNNYGCTQNHSGTAIPGQLKTASGKAVTDAQKHVAFEHPKFSLHRSIRTLRKYHDQGKQTTLAMAETWAPWCDTLGSKKTNGGWGRTCPDGLPHVSASFTPRCAKPAQGSAPSTKQCQHCNCPSQMAKFYAKGVADSSETKIVLFDASGKPTALMAKLLPRVFIFETGFEPTDALIAEGLGSFPD